MFKTLHTQYLAIFTVLKFENITNLDFTNPNDSIKGVRGKQTLPPIKHQPMLVFLSTYLINFSRLQIIF